MSNLNCIVCGEPHLGHRNRRYCLSCRREHEKKLARKYDHRKRRKTWLSKLTTEELKAELDKRQSL